MHVLSTLTLSPNQGVGCFAQGLLKSERGMKVEGISSVKEMGICDYSVMQAMHDFCPDPGQDHMLMHTGDAVAVQLVGERGWSYGRVIKNSEGQLVPDSNAGWFPSSYVTVILNDNTSSTEAKPTQPTGFVTAIKNGMQSQVIFVITRILMQRKRNEHFVKACAFLDIPTYMYARILSI